MNGKVERVVVALDAVSENRAAINAAARLAARWKTPLHGVFIEDDDLIRLAHFPFARQVTLGVGVEPFTLPLAERQMRAYAARARHDLAAAAKRHGVEWSFETVRGAENHAVASVGDFVVAGATTRPVGRHFRLEGRWWTMTAAGPDAFLLAHRESAAHGAIAVLIDNREPGSERLLTAAARLAEAHDGRLSVLATAALAGTAGFKAWLDKCLTGFAVSVDLEVALSEPAALRRRIVELNCRLVALDVDQARPERLRELVAGIACDVLVVR